MDSSYARFLEERKRTTPAPLPALEDKQKIEQAELKAQKKLYQDQIIEIREGIFFINPYYLTYSASMKKAFSKLGEISKGFHFKQGLSCVNSGISNCDRIVKILSKNSHADITYEINSLERLVLELEAGLLAQFKEKAVKIGLQVSEEPNEPPNKCIIS